jgi:hypothetical protein
MRRVARVSGGTVLIALTLEENLMKTQATFVIAVATAVEFGAL